MAENVYASVGFRDLGRILEYAPRAWRGPLSRGHVPSLSARAPGLQLLHGKKSELV